MPNLYPVFEMPEQATAVPVVSTPSYGRGPVWDYEAGDFATDGSGRVVFADGHSAWVHWCLKTAQTERFAHPVYSRFHGVELERISQTSSRREAEALITRTITEALLVDPRTDMVRDFSVEWVGDQAHVSFTAVPVVGPAERMEVIIGG